MKKVKFTTLTLLTAMLTACSSDEPTIRIDEDATASYVAKRSIEEAIQIASQYAEQTEAGSRGANLVVDKATVSAILSTSSRAASDTLMYAVNFEDNNGYMIISASKATEPILAIIDNGNYQEDENVQVDGFDYFMNAAKTYIQNSDLVVKPGIIPNPGGPLDPIMQYYSVYRELEKGYEQRLTINWGTFLEEGYFCPNHDAGCGPVAVAQVLSYFKPNMNFNVTFDGRPYDRLELYQNDWEELLKHYHYSGFGQSSCSASKEYHEKLGVLIRQIGVWSYSSYDRYPTISYPSYCFATCNDILSNRNPSFVEAGKIYDSIVNGGIALVQGADSANDKIHIWVIDGTAYIKYEVTTYKNFNPKTWEYDSKEVSIELEKYVHCNWGNYGKKNGYFLEYAFNEDEGSDAFEPIIPEPPIYPYEPASRYEYRGVNGYVYK